MKAFVKRLEMSLNVVSIDFKNKIIVMHSDITGYQSASLDDVSLVVEESDPQTTTLDNAEFIELVARVNVLKEALVNRQLELSLRKANKKNA